MKGFFKGLFIIIAALFVWKKRNNIRKFVCQNACRKEDIIDAGFQEVK